MSKHGLICFVAIISATGAALAADAGGKAAIPNFATDVGTGWRIDRTVGVDDLLAAPGGGPGPITFERAHPYAPNGCFWFGLPSKSSRIKRLRHLPKTA